MSYNPNTHHRKSIRLKGYDYSCPGLYFITICVQNRANLFGQIVVGAPLVGALVDAPINGTSTNGTPANGTSTNGATTRFAPTGTAQMILNDPGKMVESEWLKMPIRFPNIRLHEYVVMPNHFHAILEIVVVGAPLVGALVDAPINGTSINGTSTNGTPTNGTPTNGATTRVAPTKTVGEIIGAFLSITTVEYIHGVKNLGYKPFLGKLWQRNYWEHIIRNEQSFHRIRKYITSNPNNWHNDNLNGQQFIGGIAEKKRRNSL